MSEEEINAIFNSIPKVENNNCISAYGSVDIEDIKSAMKRLNKVPDYNDLLKENKELKNDLEYVLNQVLGAFTQEWCIDWNFTDIREKYNWE